VNEADDAYQFGVPRERVVLIPHGLDFGRFPQPSEDGKGDGKKLLFVGRIAEQRNAKFLLRGFALALRTDSQLRLSIAGEPLPSRYNFHEARYWHGVQSLVSRLGLGAQVDFLGAVNGPALWDLY